MPDQVWELAKFDGLYEFLESLEGWRAHGQSKDKTLKWALVIPAAENKETQRALKGIGRQRSWAKLPGQQ